MNILVGILIIISIFLILANILARINFIFLFLLNFLIVLNINFLWINVGIKLVLLKFIISKEV